jgi:hypothetical protein
MSTHDLKSNLDAYTESLVKSGVEGMGPQNARDTLEERIAPIIECFSHLVWMCGGEGDDFRKSAISLMSDALDDAFADQIKEASFESPIGHNSRQRSHGTLNARQQFGGNLHG